MDDCAASGDSKDVPKRSSSDQWLGNREMYRMQLNALHFAEKMLLELPVCPLCRSDGELVPQKFNDQLLGQMLVASCRVHGGSDLDAECSALLRNRPNRLAGCDDVEDETRIFDDNALDSDSAHTCTSHYFDFSTMQIGSR